MQVLDVGVPDQMPLEQLEAEITELAGNLAAAECRWLLLIAEYDRRGGYEEWGCRTCAQWLSWHCGLDIRAAQERVRSSALEEAAADHAEFGAGKLSYSKVRAMTGRDAGERGQTRDACRARDCSSGRPGGRVPQRVPWPTGRPTPRTRATRSATCVTTGPTMARSKVTSGYHRRWPRYS